MKTTRSQRKNIFIGGILVLTFTIGTLVYFNPPENFLGQTNINLNNEPENQAQALKPNLVGELTLTAPEDPQGDLVANVKLQNNGAGDINRGHNLEYRILINNTEVFSNEDNSLYLAAGDSVDFSYPIPRQIYNYDTVGTVDLEIDPQNTIEEENELDNKTSSNYSL